MKIVHFIFSFCTGGAETMLCDIVSEQSKNNEVHLVIINDVYEKKLIDSITSSVKIHLIGRKAHSKNPMFIIKLNFLLMALKADIYHCHHSPIIRFLKVKPRIGTFFTAHALNISTTYLHRYNAVFAISDAVRKNILERTQVKCITVENGINCDLIQKRPTNDFLLPFKIIQVGRLEHELKGQDILIEAISILRGKGIDVIVDIVGEGNSMEYLRDLTVKKGLSESINFLGIRDRNYIYSHLCSYDMMCHPARFEGFGLTVAEGMAAGLPIVIPDKGGPYEITNDGEYATTFIYADANSCADKIEEVIHNYKTAICKATEAIKYVNKKYSVKKMVELYLKEYSKN